MCLHIYSGLNASIMRWQIHGVSNQKGLSYCVTATCQSLSIFSLNPLTIRVNLSLLFHLLIIVIPSSHHCHYWRSFGTYTFWLIIKISCDFVSGVCTGSFRLEPLEIDCPGAQNQWRWASSLKSSDLDTKLLHQKDTLSLLINLKKLRWYQW